MQFKRELADAILRGQKTQTRRLVLPDEALANIPYNTAVVRIAPVTLANGHTIDRPAVKWCVGKDYPLQNGYRQKALGRICVTDIRRERLQAITEADAEAEGFLSVGAFRAAWNALYRKDGTGWHANPDVWVITFKLVEARL